jgi:hypothetical protein
MQNKIKNSETPYFSTSPVQDQFGQIIVAFGVTKREKLAMDLLISHYSDDKYPVTKQNVTNGIIKLCYKIADDFLNYEEEGQKETSSKIIM